ncbi:UTRA domain-containing protein [Allonocardiopsis opalescens]|uniref:UTRA domain-containing protein n=1 Tax=Allonocardiopsis opalescens TaxID=1144618 RepID=A0A2T0PS90_9ACTN|nr:UTRA domain-containing protein [Allonocardiopsis opalescens]PRX91755.1 UTRA domain-containing protein [Allonocardiopsis opalescens]
MDATDPREIAAIADPVERAQAAAEALAALQGRAAVLSRVRLGALAEAEAAGAVDTSGVRPVEAPGDGAEELERTVGQADRAVPHASGALREPVQASGAAVDRAPGAPRPEAAADRPSQTGSGGPGRLPADARPRVLVQRALPTPPRVRESASLFLTEARRQGVAPRREMLYIGPEPAADHVAAVLRVPPGEPVIARRKMFWAHDVPVRVSTSYFRRDVAEGTRLAEKGFVQPTLQAAITALGHRFGHAVETLTARPPTPQEADLLDVHGEWVVQVLRVGVSRADVPVHALETICAASRHTFAIGQVAGIDTF